MSNKAARLQEGTSGDGQRKGGEGKRRRENVTQNHYLLFSVSLSSTARCKKPLHLAVLLLIPAVVMG